MLLLIREALQSIQSQERREDKEDLSMLTVKKVADETFPVYVYDTLPVDTLRPVNVEPTKIVLAEDVPYFPLTVSHGCCYACNRGVSTSSPPLLCTWKGCVQG